MGKGDDTRDEASFLYGEDTPATALGVADPGTPYLFPPPAAASVAPPVLSTAPNALRELGDAAPHFRNDFGTKQRHSQWAEHMLAAAITNSPFHLTAVPYGRSRSSSSDQQLSGEERLGFKADFQRSETHGKRPDLLVFDNGMFETLKKIHGAQALYALETVSDTQADQIAMCAASAIEVETSRYFARAMKDFTKEPREQKRLKGTEYEHELCHPLSLRAPHIYLKDEDVLLLDNWTDWSGVPIFLVSLFPDLYSLAIPYDDVRPHLGTPFIPAQEHAYGTQSKSVFRLWRQLGFEFAEATESASLESLIYVTDNGKLETDYKVIGGEICLTPTSAAALRRGIESEAGTFEEQETLA